MALPNVVRPQLAAPFTKITHNDVYPSISADHALRGSALGLVVLITGAGRGIGRAQALTFAQAGAKKVVLAARSDIELKELAEEIKRASGGRTEVVAARTDVTSEVDVRRLFDLADEEVHVLINNAGIMEKPAKIHESDPDEWWKTWEVNIKGTYLPTREALKRVLATEGQALNLTIINTSSVASAGTRPGGSSYQTGKSAINRFTEFIHFEYANVGVRAFAVHPGGIMTKLAQESMPAETHSFLNDTVELAAGYSLWLATQGAKVDFLRGRYSSAKWDVDELLEREQEIREKNLLWTRVVGQEQRMS